MQLFLPIPQLDIYVRQLLQLTAMTSALTNLVNLIILPILIKETEQPAMKNKLLFFAICIAFIATTTSCKKNIETCKLGKYYESDGNSTPTANVFTYYDNGKLKSISYTNKSKDTLVYSVDTLTIFTFDNNGVLTSSVKGILNGSGYFSSAIKTSFDILGAITNTENYSFEYNAEGNMTKQTTNNSSGTRILSLTYSGGNSVSGVLYKGVILDKKYIFYHNAVENKTGVDDLTGVFNPYFGTASSLLLDSIRIISPATSDTVRIQYAHTLDNNGYISKTIQTWLSGGVPTKYHTYQYFDCR